MQSFSLAELALGLQTAAYYRLGSHPSPAAARRLRRGACGRTLREPSRNLLGTFLGLCRRYGTSEGRVAWALVALDVALAVPKTLSDPSPPP